MSVLNLSFSPATEAQRELGLVDLSVEESARLGLLIEEVSMGSVGEILEPTLQAAGLIQQWALSHECEIVYIGELDFLGEALTQLLKDIDLSPIRYLSAKMQLAGEVNQPEMVEEVQEPSSKSSFTKSQIRGSWLRITQWELAF